MRLQSVNFSGLVSFRSSWIRPILCLNLLTNGDFHHLGHRQRVTVNAKVHHRQEVAMNVDLHCRQKPDPRLENKAQKGFYMLTELSMPFTKNNIWLRTL